MKNTHENYRVHKILIILAPPQEVPPYEYNANYHSYPIEPDHAQPAYTEAFTAQPVQQAQPALPQNNYPTAVPLYALQRTPACVDCPSCGQREMTRVEFVSGSTTQSVHPSNIYYVSFLFWRYRLTETVGALRCFASASV